MSHLSYFDAHCDTLTTGSLHHHIDWNREDCRRRGQIFAICADGICQPDLSFFQTAAARLTAVPNARLCRDGAELEQAVQTGQIAAVLAVEGAETIGCEPEHLTAAYAAGVRMIGLTHNRFCGLAGTCVDHPSQGLTESGRTFAEQAVALGMLLDISHLSDAGAYELMNAYPGRVMASHSNARRLCDHPRNLTDELFLKLLDAQGICGINFYTRFLTGREDASADDVVRQIEYLAALDARAVRALALGCDFDGCDTLPSEMQTSAAVEVLAEALLRRNYSQETVERFFFDNLYQFLRRTL